MLSYFTAEAKEEVPLRSKREKCWEARDQYNSCLDKLGVENPNDPKFAKSISRNCSKEEKHFSANCALSWVSYFKEKRYVDIKKEKMMKQMEQENAKLVELPRE